MIGKEVSPTAFLRKLGGGGMGVVYEAEDQMLRCDGDLAEIKGEPLLHSLEGDPRYRAFLQKMKLPVD